MYFSRSQYFHVVYLLNVSFELLCSSSLNEIDGLADLREEIIERKNQQQQELTEILHQQIYRKTENENNNNIQMQKQKQKKMHIQNNTNNG